MPSEKKKYSKQLSFGSDENGKRIRKNFSYNTQKELNEQIARFLEELKVKPKEYAEGNKMTFTQFFEHWLETYKAKSSPATREMYYYAYKRCPSLMDKLMDKITFVELTEAVNEIEGSDRCVKQAVLTIRAMFKMALREGIIEKDIAIDLKAPERARAKEKRALTTQEKEAIKFAKFNAREKLMVNILYTYGLRPGELFALTKDDFDLEGNVLKINKATGHDRHLSFIKGTKNGTERNLPLTESIKTDYAEMLSTMLISATFIFYGKDDKPASKTVENGVLRRIVGKINSVLGYETGITAYTFRHNAVTRMYYDGYVTGKVSTKQIAKLFGNSEKMIIETYSHIQQADEDLTDLYPEW